MPFPFSLQKKQTPPKGASPLNGDIAPARGQQVDEKVNKPLQRHEANVDTFGSVCGLHPTDLAMYCLNDKLGAWRLYTMPSDARPPVNAREQARLPADAPWEPWHDLPPLREGVPAPDWGPKPENVRGFNDRNFIGPLESTHTMYEVDTLYFPVMPPRRSWWKTRFVIALKHHQVAL
ncbi:hypothetical protein Esti_003422 [Eimeria stiedai]